MVRSINYRATALALTFLLLLGLSVAGCGGEQDTANQAARQADQLVDQATETADLALARKAALVALEIERDPASTEVILQRNGMTLAEFDALMYKIAGSEELTAAFERAKGTP